MLMILKKAKHCLYRIIKWYTLSPQEHLALEINLSYAFMFIKHKYK